MNRIKKAVFGVLVAGLAFGFSAFKTVKRQNILTYYKTDVNYPVASDYNGYSYFSGDRCESSGNLCSADWDIGSSTTPSEGSKLPATAIIVPGTITTGHFE